MVVRGRRGADADAPATSCLKCDRNSDRLWLLRPSLAPDSPISDELFGPFGPYPDKSEHIMGKTTAESRFTFRNNLATRIKIEREKNGYVCLASHNIIKTQGIQNDR